MATLTGFDPNDTIDGTDEADVISGGFGADLLNGWGGDDFIIDGHDTGNDFGGDTLNGGDGNDTLTGHGRDTINMNSADLLNGDAGDDLLLLDDHNNGDQGTGIATSVTVNGGIGDDTITGMPYGDAGILVHVDGAFIDGGDGHDYIEISGFDSTLNGDGGNDTIIGGSVAGGETGWGEINGGAGDDVIHLYAANMLMSGGAGNDTFVLPMDPIFYGFTWSTIADFVAGEDRFDITPFLEDVEFFYERTITDPFAEGFMRFLQNGVNAELEVNSVGTWHPYLVLRDVDAWSLVNGEHADNLFVQGIDLTGALILHRTWGTVASETFSGNEGNDTFLGQAGNDTISGQAGNDEISGGEGKDRLYGNDGNDTITGDAGVDKIYGGAGDDRLTGYGGDLVAGGDGNDMIYGYVDANGTVTITGGLGDDILLATGVGVVAEGGAGNDILWSQLGGQVFFAGTGNDTANGGTGNDSFYGDGGDDSLNGVWGDDLLVGGNGNDRISGGKGNDTIDGGAQRDNLRGWDGDDSISGGDGADYLGGDNGSDVLHGGGGRDSFAFLVDLGTTGVDVIADFTAADDTIDILMSLTNLSAGALAAGAFSVGANAGEGDDRIVYDISNGALYYDADGNGEGAQVQFAQIGAGGVALTHEDFLIR